MIFEPWACRQPSACCSPQAWSPGPGDRPGPPWAPVWMLSGQTGRALLTAVHLNTVQGPEGCPSVIARVASVTRRQSCVPQGTTSMTACSPRLPGPPPLQHSEASRRSQGPAPEPALRLPNSRPWELWGGGETSDLKVRITGFFWGGRLQTSYVAWGHHSPVLGLSFSICITRGLAQGGGP